jgi:hypothetical protein
LKQDYFLLDGQHRLRLAFRIGMKYIDVIMEKKKDLDVSKKMKDEIKKREAFKKEARKILKIKKSDSWLYW